MLESRKVYIGYDSREDIAFRVCQKSILEKTNNVSIYPLISNDLRKKGIYWRNIDNYASTEFTITRFLVPYLNQYKGWAVYCDCDFLWNVDINNLFNLCIEKYAVMVVKHDYAPVSKTKMDGKQQFLYPRKNWSSMILWNCGHPYNKQLSLETVNNSNPSFLHRLQWLPDNLIGELDKEWNWLVGWHKKDNFLPNAIHYTEGGPWFEEYSNCDFSEEWKNCKDRLFFVKKQV